MLSMERDAHTMEYDLMKKEEKAVYWQVLTG